MEWTKAETKDFEALAAFYRHVIDNTEHMDVYARWVYGLHPDDRMITDYINSGFMYIMKDGDKITGACAVADRQEESYRGTAWGIDIPDDGAAVLHILCADPCLAGRGTASAMLRAIEENAAKDGKKAVRLDTFRANLPARHLYEKNGYIKRGTALWRVDNMGTEEFCLYEKIL